MANSNSNANLNSNASLNSGSNLNVESDSSGSVVVTTQTAAQNSIQNSNIENIRQDSENNNNSNQTVNSGGNNRGPRPRITQPPFNSAVNAGWPPYGLPHNYSPSLLNSNFGNNSNPAFQFGSVPNSNNQFFPEMSRSVGASSSNPGVLIQTPSIQFWGNRGKSCSGVIDGLGIDKPSISCRAKRRNNVGIIGTDEPSIILNEDHKNRDGQVVANRLMFKFTYVLILSTA
ncbi:hypothetical protein PIB30_070263 [Stylosanthes scabra]|uniref:Uncharacterized protein n=1 Tax=Stylosanthes scabra TaxID=79078 RepID=A0ABU6YMG4_9FABA|nr:hypothetical protein [Stylosanthes scabra]